MPNEDSQEVDAGEEFVELITSFQGRLYAFILSLLSNRDEANDVLQETNIVLWRKSGEYVSGTNFKAWSFRVAAFQVMAHRKRQKRDRLVMDDSCFEQLMTDAQEVDETYEGRRVALRSCMTKLNERHQRLIHRRYRENVSLTQIAQETDQNENSIAQALFRARKTLMNCVKRHAISFG